MTGTRHGLDATALRAPASTLLASRFVRFICVGGLNTLVGYAAFILALSLHLAAVPALAVATAFSMLFNFQTSRRLVFRAGKDALLSRFVLVQGIVLAINALALHLLVRLGIAPWLAQALLILPVAATGYIAQRNLVFAERAQPRPRVARLRTNNRLVLVFGSGLFLLPNGLFALSLHWLPATLLLVGALVFVAMRPASTPGALLEQPIDGRRLGLCAAAALLLLLLGGEAHVFYANWDWLWRDAVLADLVRAPFPPTYAVGDGTFVLRAPLGMYMLPALVAKAAGLGLGHVALLAQNTALLTCELYILALLAGRRALLVVAIFLSFSGLDILGQLVRFAQRSLPAAAFYPPAHIESWTLFQYSSTLTQLFWVPNHALPCYWMALAALLCVVGELTIADFGLAMATVLFWSPFAVIGALPFAVFVFLRSARASLRSPRLWLAAATSLCFLPVAIYMQADAAKVPHGFQPMTSFMLAIVLQFLMIEIPHVLVVSAAWRDLDGRFKGLTLVSLTVLVCLPFIKIGAGNDLVMRASIPALTILAFVFAQSLTTAWPSRRMVCFVAFAIVAVGCVTPAMEVVRALVVPRYAVSECGFVSVWKSLLPNADVSNYLARAAAMPDWISQPAPPLAEGPRACWPDLAPENTLSPGARIARSMSAGSTSKDKKDAH